MATKRPSRDEYQRVREEKLKIESAENEIRVTAAHGQHSYISYAIAVLNGEDGKTKNDTVKISGMGGAIFNAVNIAEIVKRRVAGLHQVTEINSEVVKDEYEPKDRTQHAENLVVERKVSTILITLSRQPLDRANVGYQEPIPEDQVTEQEEREPGQRRGGNGGRGGNNSRGGRGGNGGRGGRGGNNSRGGRGGRGGNNSRGGRGGNNNNNNNRGGNGNGNTNGGRGAATAAAAAAGAEDRRDARE